MTELKMAAGAAALLMALPAAAQEEGRDSVQGAAVPGQTYAARAEVTREDGGLAGTVYMESRPEGTVMVSVALSALPQGDHSLAILAEGTCPEPGGDLGDRMLAGMEEEETGDAEAPPAGDLPVVTANADGDATAEIENDRLDLNRHVFDPDGSAFIVRQGRLDGPLIACGVLEQVPAGEVEARGTDEGARG